MLAETRRSDPDDIVGEDIRDTPPSNRAGVAGDVEGTPSKRRSGCG